MVVGIVCIRQRSWCPDRDDANRHNCCQWVVSGLTYRYSVFQDTTDAVQQAADPAVLSLWPVSQVRAMKLDGSWTVLDADAAWRGMSLHDLLKTPLVPWRPTGAETDTYKVRERHLREPAA